MYLRQWGGVVILGLALSSGPGFAAKQDSGRSPGMTKASQVAAKKKVAAKKLVAKPKKAVRAVSPAKKAPQVSVARQQGEAARLDPVDARSWVPGAAAPPETKPAIAPVSALPAAAAPVAPLPVASEKPAVPEMMAAESAAELPAELSRLVDQAAARLPLAQLQSSTAQVSLGLLAGLGILGLAGRFRRRWLRAQLSRSYQRNSPRRGWHTMRSYRPAMVRT